MATHVLTIDGWHPTSLNRMLGYHWTRRRKLKAFDRDVIALEALRLPRATGKRRVSIHLTLAPRQRGYDPDNLLKGLLDGLKHAGMLVDDSRTWCELGPVTFGRGVRKATTITLEDICDG